MNGMKFWWCEAKYKDGTTVEKMFAYKEHGCYLEEEERQYQLEEWLLKYHEDCVWYNVEIC